MKVSVGNLAALSCLGLVLVSPAPVAGAAPEAVDGRPQHVDGPGIDLAAGMGPEVVAAQGIKQADGASRLLVTGQGSGFKGDVSEPFDGNGDDGDLIFGLPFDYDHDNAVEVATQAENVAVDANTGLAWIRTVMAVDGQEPAGLGGNVALNQALTWQAALDRVAALEYAGHADWRMPNVHELSTIVDFGRAQPALDSLAFPEPFADLPSPYFWTSTTNPHVAFEAFYVNSLDGHSLPWAKGVEFMVRPVRDVAGAAARAVTLATGQTASYTGNFGERGPGNADDGALQRGSVPDIDHADDGRIDTAAENVATDRLTRLQWIRDPRLVDGAAARDEGGVDLSAPMGWQAGIESCLALEYAGYDDWRVPNIRELQSIAQFGKTRTFDPVIFPGAPEEESAGRPFVWWSSTTNSVDRPGAPAKDAAWYLTASGSAMRHSTAPDHQPAKSRPAFVRCVRGGETVRSQPGYMTEIRGSHDFEAVTVEGLRVKRVGKYLLAATDDAPFEAAFQDVAAYPLHLDFLRETFPNRYGALTPAEYASLTAYRATRQLLAGGLAEFETADGERVYGFDVYTADGNPAELLTEAETRALYGALAQRFLRRPLVYSPTQPAARELALDWQRPGFPIAFPEPPPPDAYQAYTLGVAYGTVRVLRLDELPSAVADGLLDRRSIVVVDAAPADLEAVVSAIFTAEPQAELSHLAVRAARRGTPNAFAGAAEAAFRPLDGRLARVIVTRGTFSVEPATIEAAAAHWAATAPEPVEVPEPDLAYDALPGLDDLTASTAVRVGGKAANLATLYGVLTDTYEVPAFAVPFSAYAAHIDSGTIYDFTDPRDPMPLAEYIERLATDARLRTDTIYRRAKLRALREAIAAAPVSAELTARLAARIAEVHGAGVMVRFRSSSNAEDSLRFNGAGLYDSTSVCAADSLDGDTRGPSRCNPAEPDERTIERGLRRVWASLWSDRAWDERDYYSIDGLRVAMGILVTPAFPDERANGVAFTGNPMGGVGNEYLVNVQQGDVSVVHPDPGILPERDAIEIHDGRVSGVRRFRGSTLLPEGEWVLSDAELLELGRAMLVIERRFPVELGDHRREDVLLDLEFKLRREDDSLVIKQIRPFLVTEASLPDQGGRLYLEVGGPIELCSMWRPVHAVTREYADQIRVELAAEDVALDLDVEAGSQPLFDRAYLGPEGVPAEPVDEGGYRVAPEPGRPGLSRVTLTRHFAGPSRAFTVTTTFLNVRTEEPNLAVIDGGSLLDNVAVVAIDDAGESQTLGPCGLDVLPRLRVDVELEGGQSAVFWMRKGGGLFSYQPAALTKAVVHLADGTAEVTDLRRLIYDAERHNWNESLFAVFEEPIGDAHALELRQVGAGTGDGDYTATLLGAELQRVAALVVRRVRVSADESRFSALLPWAGR